MEPLRRATRAINVYTCTCILCSVNLDVKPGQLVAVVGQVGAGKSSLIQALLGEMEKQGGNVALRVSVRYHECDTVYLYYICTDICTCTSTSPKKYTTFYLYSSYRIAQILDLI